MRTITDDLELDKIKDNNGKKLEFKRTLSQIFSSY